MGHRHFFSTSQTIESDNDQGWNNVEQYHMHLDNNSLLYPVENMLMGESHYPPQWNPVPSLHGYYSSSQSGDTLHCQQEASGPSHDPFLHPSAAVNFNMIPENYAYHVSTPNCVGQSFNDGGFCDLTMGNRRGPYKRKSPSVPAVCGRDNKSRCDDAECSSVRSISSDLWQEKPNADAYRTPWNFPNIPPGYGGNSLSVSGEGNMRNVRSRAALDLETNLARTHSPNNPSCHSYTTSQSINHSNSVDLLGQSSNAATREWNCTLISPAPHQMPVVSDTNVFSHGENHFIVGNSYAPAALEIGGYNNNDFMLSRNPISQSLQGTSTQSVRGVRSSYTQRSIPTFRASSSNLCPGNPASPDEGLQLIAESSSSRHPRSFSSVRWRNSDQNRRRLASEGLVIMDHSDLYGPRNLLDHRRDMRLDIDNMSYEELLALGERIGNVNTGLSEDMISKCITELIYCSSDNCQEEGKCVICLEEYVNMDDIGTLKVCSHDFHVKCIRKWLSMKNWCPICKADMID